MYAIEPPLPPLVAALTLGVAQAGQQLLLTAYLPGSPFMHAEGQNQSATGTRVEKPVLTTSCRHGNFRDNCRGILLLFPACMTPNPISELSPNLTPQRHIPKEQSEPAAPTSIKVRLGMMQAGDVAPAKLVRLCADRQPVRGEAQFFKGLLQALEKRRRQTPATHGIKHRILRST